MLSGVAAESGLFDLHLNGAKAPILVTNHRASNVRIPNQTQFSYSSAQTGTQHQQTLQPSTLSYRLHFCPEVSSPRVAKTPNCKPKDSDNNGTLPRFDATHKPPSYFNQNTIPSSVAKSSQPSQDGPDVEITLLPPARQSTSLVAIGANTDSDENQRFGNLEEQDWSADAASLSEDDDQCPSGQTEGQWPGHQTQTYEIPSCSRSSKENVSPKPPEYKKKKVKQKLRKVRKSASRRNSGIKKATMRQNITKQTESGGIPTTAPASISTSTNKTLRLSCAPVMLYTHKPKTAQSAPEFAQSSLKQRHDISRAIYSRQSGQNCVMPSRSRTLPTVENCISSRSVNADLPRQSTSVSSTSPDAVANVLQMRLSDNSKQIIQVKDSPTHCRKTTAQYWGRLIKVYLSEKQSGSLRDREWGTEYPCAPPATPTPDQLQRYKYIPSMNDVKAQRAVKCKLQALEKAEQKRQEKQHGKKTKAEKQVLKDNEKVLKQRQRQEIYALNSVMTELEYNRFVAFCLSNNIQPT